MTDDARATAHAALDRASRAARDLAALPTSDLEAALHSPFNPASILADRQMPRGKIEANPDNEAFALTHTLTLTLSDLADAITAEFGTARRVSASSVPRRWKCRGRTLPIPPIAKFWLPSDNPDNC
jgi:hypothetical protein